MDLHGQISRFLKIPLCLKCGDKIKENERPMKS